MARAVVLCTAVLLLVSSVLAQTSPHAHTSGSAIKWTEGYTLILVEASTNAELAQARDFVISQGGTVAVVVPPHAIFGWLSPDVESKLVGRHKIRSIHRSEVKFSSTGFTDRDTESAIAIFNDIVSGRYARNKTIEISAQSQSFRPPMLDCAQPSPPLDEADFIRNLRALGIDQSKVEPRFFDNSNVMDGTVAVGVFLIESNGAIDPNINTWSEADQDRAIAQVIDGLSWWVDQSRAFALARPLQFTVVPFRASNPVCQQPYEPILHPGSDANLWIDRIMTNLGVPSGDIFVKVATFDRKIRDENRANWAFSIFVAYNPEPARTSYTDGRASWAYLGGPHSNILFRSFGWPLSQIVTHEVGHIFYACDEYFQPGFQTCSCSCAPEVRPRATNGNCEDVTCNAKSAPCMMRINEFALCSFTVAQIGWTSAVPKPLPTAPANLLATASAPTQVNLIWQDTSTTEDGFQIERRGGSDGNFSQIAVVGANSIAYSDATVLPNTAYAYRVRAFNNTGASSFSSEAGVVTPSVSPALSIATTDMPDATANVPYSRTLVAVGGKPGYNWVIESGSLPAGLALSPSGTISGTPPTAGTTNFVVRVTDADNNTLSKGFSLIVKPAAPLAITSKDLPRGSVGTTYSQNLGAAGGQTPYTWSLESGSLPFGLTLNQSGIISGTPERAGTSSFVLKLADATGANVTATLSIAVNPAITQLTIETSSLPDGVVGQDYSQAIKAVGGNAPYSFEVASGRLPDGLRMSASGVIEGKPGVQGDFDFQIKVSDQSGQSVSKALSIDIDPAPQLTILSQTPLPPAAVGVPYRVELQATAGLAPYKWNKKKKKKFGLLPDGLSLSSEGVISGTPTAQGAFNFTVQVSDFSDKSASKPLSIEVGPPPPPLAVTTTTLPNALTGLPYRATLEATGGVAPYSWSLDSGALPDGLTISSAGIITGRANSTASTPFTVRVKDAVGTSSARNLFITVMPPPPPLVIATVQLPEASAERAYLQSLQASGGVPPYTWSIASGELATGLNLTADGIISGTPQSATTSVFTIRVTDSAQQSVTRTLAIIVKPADKLAPFGVLETPDSRAGLNNIANGSGWALDNIGVVRVEALIDGERITDAIYGISRPDIAVVWGSFPNSGNAGFSFTFDTSKLSSGEHRLSVRLSDAAGNITVLGTRPIFILNQSLSISSVDIAKGKKGEHYSSQLSAINGRPPYTWALISGSLSQGLTMSASGAITGTPSVAGTFSFTVRVTDSQGASAIASFILIILPDIEPLAILSSGPQTPGVVDQDYSQQLFFSGGRSPRTWSIVSGALPPGLSLNTSTGTISGKPTQAGTFKFRVRLTDATPTSVTSEELSITISPPATQT